MAYTEAKSEHLSQLEAFNDALRLAEQQNFNAANLVLAQLRQQNNANLQLLVGYLFTCTNAYQARVALDLLLLSDPYHPQLPAACYWVNHLETREHQLQAANFSNYLQRPLALEVATLETEIRLAPQRIIAPPAPIADNTWFWWTVFITSSIMCLGLSLYLLLVPRPFTDSEQEYVRQTSRLSTEVNAINRRLATLSQQDFQQFGVQVQYQRELEGLAQRSREFKLLRSPSTRFEKLDQLLGLAYENLENAATRLSKGLAENNQLLILEGNRNLEAANQFLQQARASLDTIQ